MSAESRAPLWFTIIFKFALNVLLVWLLATKLHQYFQLEGDSGSYVVIASLLTLLNLFVRPLLTIVTLPLRLFATLLAFIIVHGVFLLITVRIAAMMDPEVLTLSIAGGMIGWIVVALVLGTGNWAMRLVIS